MDLGAGRDASAPFGSIVGVARARAPAATSALVPDATAPPRPCR